MSYNNEFLVQIRDEVVTLFNSEELIDLCFQLGINHEELVGNAPTIKARELINHYKRQNQIGDLVYKLIEHRPKGDWFVYIADLITQNCEEARIQSLFSELNIEPKISTIRNDKHWLTTYLQENGKAQQQIVINLIDSILKEMEETIHKTGPSPESPERKKYFPLLILVLILLLLGILCLLQAFISNMFFAGNNSNTHFVFLVRVQRIINGDEIESANVKIDVRGANSFRDITDSEGVATFSIPIEYLGEPGTLIVDAEGFYQKNIGITLNQNQLPLEIHLEPIDISTFIPPSEVASPTIEDTEESIEVTSPPTFSPTATMTPTNTLVPTPSSTHTTTPTFTPTICAINPPPGWGTYRIQSNDTLSALATQSGETTTHIQEVNCIEGSIISIDQQLWLPFTQTPTHTPSPIDPIPPGSSVTNTPTPPRSTPPPPQP